MRRLIAVLVLAACSAASLSAQSKTAAKAPKGGSVKPVWPDEGPKTWTPRPTVAEITANDLRTRLYQFADDSMLGRRIGEPSNHKATAYIAREFQRLGLKPAGDSGTFFQNLPFGPLGLASLRREPTIRTQSLTLIYARSTPHEQTRVTFPER